MSYDKVTSSSEFKWYSGAQGLDAAPTNKTQIKNMNISIHIMRGRQTTENADVRYNTVDEKTTYQGDAVKKSQSNEQVFRLTENDEKFALNTIFGLDGNVNDFSTEDWNTLSGLNGKKYTNSTNKHFFTINVNNDVVELTLRNDRSQKIGTVRLDRETSEEAIERKYNEAEKLKQEQIKNLIEETGYLKCENFENIENNGKLQQFVNITITNSHTLENIRNDLNLNQGVLIKYNPWLKDEVNLWNKVAHGVTGKPLYDLIQINSKTIQIPTDELI